MSDTKIQQVRSDAAGTLLRRGAFTATRGAYHMNGYDPSFAWNLWTNGRLVEVATTRKDAEKWLRQQESCHHCQAHVYNDGGVWMDYGYGIHHPHTCGRKA